MNPAGDSRSPLLDRVSATDVLDLLEALGNPKELAEAALRLVIKTTEASRGIAITGEQVVAQCGFEPSRVAGLAARLRLTLPHQRLVAFSSLRFCGAVPHPGPAVGLALSITAGGLTLVVAVERGQPFPPAAVTGMQGLHGILENALAVTARLSPPRQSRSVMAAEELPLDRLSPFPQLRELERLLIEAALRRERSRAEAARVLGVTREGLRKKMIRLGLLEQWRYRRLPRAT
jgi:DNA-binding NtrC family response regulator